MNQVVCEHPRIIINPLLKELICVYRHYFLNGHADYFTGKHPDLNFPYDKFSVRKNVFSESSLETSYVIDVKTGQTFPIYQKVPCGQCSACHCLKQNAYVNRCQFETMCYDSKPLFITLTYDDVHIPCVITDDDAVVYTLKVRDIQLFFKRFRQNIKRQLGIDNKIRYSVCGEYGKNTHRPHYHAIIWNLPVDSNKDYLKLLDCVERSWHNGFVTGRVISPEKDGSKTFRYTCKYMQKKQRHCFPDYVYDLPEFKDSFHCSSKSHGGIGAHFIDRYKIGKLTKDMKFLNKFTQSVDNFYFTSYVINRLRPSYSRLVPAAYRNAVKELYMYDVDGKYDDLVRLLRYEKPCYIPRSRPRRADNVHYKNADECFEFIMKWRNNDKYVLPDVARLRDIERQGFLFHFFDGMPEKCINSYIYKSRQILQRQFSTELL